MRMMSTLLVMLAAAGAALYFFAPERLPFGLGLQPMPLELTTRSSLLGRGRVAVIDNPSDKTLHNVRIVGRNFKDDPEKTHIVETWAPGHKIQLGWLEGWRIESGVEITITADGYVPQTWEW